MHDGAGDESLADPVAQPREMFTESAQASGGLPPDAVQRLRKARGQAGANPS
jgi:hypothetical protein